MHTGMDQNSRYSQPFPASPFTEHLCRSQPSQARFCPIRFFINLYFTLFVTNARGIFFSWSHDDSESMVGNKNADQTEWVLVIGKEIVVYLSRHLKKLRWKSQRIKIDTLGYGFPFWKSQTFGKRLETFGLRIFFLSFFKIHRLVWIFLWNFGYFECVSSMFC